MAYRPLAHRTPLCRAPALLLLLGLLPACGGDAGFEACLGGARVCSGNTVLVCDPTTGRFETDYTCPVTAPCFSGECVGGRPGLTGPDARDLDGLEPATMDAAGTDGAPALSDGSASEDTPGPTDPGDPGLDATSPDTASVPDTTASDPDLPPPPDPGPPVPDTLPPDPGPPVADTTPLDPGPPPPDTATQDTAPPPDAGPPCGNGALDPGETCDPALPSVPCPSSCPPGAGCTTYGLVGSPSTCDVHCQAAVISTPKPGDGCCPAGYGPADDPDCGPWCGNGVKEAGEQCDGQSLGGATCASLGLGAGALVCVGCVIDSAGCAGAAPGPLQYEPVPNILLVGDIHAVKWALDGQSALLVMPDGKMARYEAADGALVALDPLPGSTTSVTRAPGAETFRVSGVGKDGTGRIWQVSADGETVTEAATIPYGTPRAIVPSPDGTRYAVASSAANLINYLFLVEDGAGVVATKGYNGPGVRHVMWALPALYAGSDALITSDGDNGADSHTWILQTDMVLANGFKASFGNPGGAGWRPGGSYGILTGTSSNKLYVFDGAWTSATLPGVGTAAQPTAVIWKQDGTRALILGGAIGPGLSATVIDHRPATTGGFDPTTLVKASIPSWDAAPWFGTSYSRLIAADWRPETTCAEGLIVGADPGPGWNPQLGVVVRFFDSTDPACLAP